MDFGYIRIEDKSEIKKNITQLQQFGCDEWTSEAVDGKINRAAFDVLVTKLRDNEDRFVIPTLTMLPLTTIETLHFLGELHKRTIRFVSLAETDIDTKTAFYFSAYAKITKRQRAAGVLAENRKRGTNGGKKPGMTQKQKIIAYSMAAEYQSKVKQIKQIMEDHNVKSKQTFYKYIAFAGVDIKRNKKRNFKSL